MNRIVLAILVLVATALMGSGFTIGKIGLTYVTPLLLVGLRFFIAGVVMAILVFLMKRPHPTDCKSWGRILLIGFFQTTAVFAAMFISLRTITAGESSILTFTNPLLVIIFSAVVLKLNFRFIQWLSVIVGFTGVFITLGGQLQFKLGTIIGFSGAVFWAIATILVNRWGKEIDTWVLSAYQMLFGGSLLLFGAFFFEDTQFTINETSIFALFWLAIMTSVIQFTIWFFLLQQGNPAKVSSFLFFAPLFGVIFGWLLLDEPLEPTIIIGGGFIFSGIFLVNWPVKKSFIPNKKK